ncbi:glycosyltransferase family 2 protein [Aequorivita marina]|uniref:glycosyltransferase family 2 protein n=1 Tax=Aequorivita marina TaxID=3073654 RepID=UPI0028754230|nr:glycosyltransferase family 2 protein [Aequorivita sp. S2608]MDS1299061.1 glycosyltransferase family 2 protein [Aequorivita sp. S2608]
MKAPLVSILCVTYNHEQFIGACLESLVSQKCDFNFEILIHDDASTDGTQDIIKTFQKKYPDIVKPILQTENQWSKQAGGINLRFNYPRAKGKFIALCDGDDYWIGADKLENQVRFLENNPNYSLVCGGYNLVENGVETPVIKSGLAATEKEDEKGFSFNLEALIKGWFIRPSTVLFRDLPDQADIMESYEFSFDVHLFYHLLRTKDAYYSKAVLAGYNRHGGGVYSGRRPQDLLLAHYYIFKEIYERDNNEFVKKKYLDISYKVLNLRISGLMPTRKIKTLALKNKNVGIRDLYKEIKSLINTKEEQQKLQKSLIPLQLKLIKAKVFRLLSPSKKA